MSKRVLEQGLFDGLNCFSELESRICRLPTPKERGDAFEVFAEAYLATQRITQAKEVWPFDSVSPSIRRELALDTGRDMGVDGVYRTVDDQYHAYQVKFRNRREPLTWTELSTFLALADHGQISLRTLFTNCDEIQRTAVERGRFVAIRGNDLDRLTKADFEAIHGWLRGPAAAAKHLCQPRDYQEQALDAIQAALRLGDRAKVIMACGTGKTLVALWAAQRHSCRTVLVLVPSLALVRQLLHEWMRETSWKISYRCVCSDPTVSQDEDALLVDQADLDFPVTTDSAQLRQFLAAPFDGVKIVFSTYQSAPVVAEGMIAPFDLAIFDEAHKTAGREGSRFAFALNDRQLAAAKRLFFTATPRHYSVRARDDQGDAKPLYSMDRDKLYGVNAYTLTFAEAARRGIICDYKVLISVVTTDAVNTYLLRHGVVSVAGDQVRARQVALQLALRQAVEHHPVRKIFTFHGSVKAAQSFVSSGAEGIGSHLTAFLPFHINGRMPTAEREAHMNAFRSAERAVMSNVRCLAEGVDVPAVDMVAFMSPRKSRVDIVQAIGRAMRRAGTKKVGYVLMPVFLEVAKGETLDDALGRTGFDDVWEVLEALKEQDEVFVEIIRQMREDRGRVGGYDESRLRERVELLAPELPLDTIRSAITVQCIEQLGATWDEHYGELLRFKEMFGHCNVSTTSPEHRLLGSWVSNQRNLSKKGKLLQPRIARLNDLGFVWDLQDKQWEDKYAELVKYKARFGDCRVPFEWPENRELSLWVGTQRHEKRAGRKRLDAENIRRLDELGFDWEPMDARWEENFAALVEYHQEHGDFNVPPARSKKPGLRRWINKLREDKKSGQLPAERAERLERLGFTWTPMEDAWNTRYSELVDFKRTHGHCDVRKLDNRELAEWLTELRKRKNQGRLPPERASLLDELGFIWDALEADWERMFAALVDYRKRYGDCHVPAICPENEILGRWVRTQRQRKKVGKLAAERAARLDAIEFSWERFDQMWQASYDMLVAYKKFHGHCSVPQSWPENPRLGKWVSDQRKKRREGKLDTDQVRRLNAIGFVWEPKNQVEVTLSSKPNNKTPE